MSLLDPQSLFARKNVIGVLGCCLNPCRKACCFYDCDLAFSNTIVLWGIGCRKFFPGFLCCAKGTKSTFPKLAASIIPRHLYLAGSDLCQVLWKIRGCLVFGTEEKTLVNREKPSLTFIMYSFPPVDFTDFGPDRSTKYRSAGLAPRV